ncbi:MAG: caspase family protein [Saprospiraceae bacterium]|nr:caspase family protein [Saprospiraceae bacterium]
MKNLLSVLLFLLPFATLAQLTKIVTKPSIGEDNDEVIYQAVQALNGKIYAVGETSSKTKGGSDGFLLILDPFSQLKIERKFGGEEDDVLQSIAALPNGNFVLVGKTRSKGNGKFDAWVIYVDDKGIVIEDKVYGSPGNDAFNVVTASDNGSVFFVGYLNDQKQSDLWFVKEVNGKETFNKTLMLGNVKNIKSGVDTEGGVVLVGDTKKDEDAWVAQFDKSGNLVGSFRQYGNPNTLEEAAQIIKTFDGGYAIVGKTNQTKGKKINAWLLKLNANLDQSWQDTYGGSDFDWGVSVTQTTTGDYILVGSTLSHAADARTRQNYIVRVNSGGKEPKENYEGGKLDDDASFILTLHDGSYGFFSSSSVITKGKDIIYFTFKMDEDNLDNQVALNENSLLLREWKINGGDLTLETNQLAYMSVNVVNNTSNFIKNVQLHLKKPAEEINVPLVTYLGVLRKNETRRVIIPVRTTAGLLEGQYDLDAKLVSYNDNFAQTTKTIQVKRVASKVVYISQVAKKLTDTAITFVLINPSNVATKELSLNFDISNGAVGTNTANLKTIAPLKAGESRELTLRLKPNTEGANRSKTVVVVSLTESVAFRDKVTFEVLPQTTQLFETRITWHSPDQYRQDIQNITTNTADMTIELNIDALEPVQRNRFRVFIDGVPTEGSKMDVADLSDAAPQGSIYRQTYSAKLSFNKPKSYEVRVELMTNKGMVSSETMIVKYDPERPNLHILSIGTTSRDLKYPPKDAKDFAKTLENKAKGVFKQIYTTTLTDSLATTDKSMRLAFRDLRLSYDNPSAETRIFSKDYLVVFISSHGKTGEDNSFKLLPSDYNPAYGDEFTVDYQNTVMNTLDKIKCHKLVFIDACHSGAARGTKGSLDAETLMKLTKAATGTTTITSCRSDELSYEDDEWQNGAFTEALIEAMNNTQCKDETGPFSSDENIDSKITINEMYNFIKRRVPNLVKSQKTSRVTEQNPVLNAKELDMELPLIKY